MKDAIGIYCKLDVEYDLLGLRDIIDQCLGNLETVLSVMRFALDHS